MLTEEALIVLAALGALALVVLGTVELLWRSRPKHPVRPASPPEPSVSPEAPPAERAPVGRRWRSSHPRHAAGARERYLKRPTLADTAPAAAVPAPLTSAPSNPPPPTVPPQPEPRIAVDRVVDSPVAIVDRCFELHQGRRHTEVVAMATAALAGIPRERILNYRSVDFIRSWVTELTEGT